MQGNARYKRHTTSFHGADGIFQGIFAIPGFCLQFGWIKLATLRNTAVLGNVAEGWEKSFFPEGGR